MKNICQNVNASLKNCHALQIKMVYQLPEIIYKPATIGPPAKRHLNDVSLVGR